jgi:energy-coupling factor transporter transmembrane protein EcfT
MVHFITSFAQTASTGCMKNGQPVDCSEIQGTLAAVFIPFTIIGIVLMIFWVISLVHLFKHADVPNRALWIVLHFVGLGPLAGIIYFFAVKRGYDKAHP